MALTGRGHAGNSPSQLGTVKVRARAGVAIVLNPLHHPRRKHASGLQVIVSRAFEQGTHPLNLIGGHSLPLPRPNQHPSRPAPRQSRILIPTVSKLPISDSAA